MPEETKGTNGFEFFWKIKKSILTEIFQTNKKEEKRKRKKEEKKANKAEKATKRPPSPEEDTFFGTNL